MGVGGVEDARWRLGLAGEGRDEDDEAAADADGVGGGEKLNCGGGRTEAECGREGGVCVDKNWSMVGGRRACCIVSD